MPSEIIFPAARMVGALFVMARVAGAFVFVPIPGIRYVPSLAKLIIILAVTLALYPLWPDAQTGLDSTGWVVMNLLIEAALGISVGLVIALSTEVLLVAFQALGLQAGYTFASTVDPETQADSSVLLVLGQLVSGLMFFTLGLHREVLLVFARSIEINPPGAVTIPHAVIDDLIPLSAGVFSTGLRLALPVITFLMMVDLSLALMGRVNQQLQLIFLAFPAKMLTTSGFGFPSTADRPYHIW